MIGDVFLSNNEKYNMLLFTSTFLFLSKFLCKTLCLTWKPWEETLLKTYSVNSYMINSPEKNPCCRLSLYLQFSLAKVLSGSSDFGATTCFVSPLYLYMAKIIPAAFVLRGLSLFTAKITPDVLSYTEVPLFLYMAKIILAALSFKGCPYSLQKSYQMFCLIRRFHCTYSLQNSYHLLCLTRTT